MIDPIDEVQCEEVYKKELLTEDLARLYDELYKNDVLELWEE